MAEKFQGTGPPARTGSQQQTEAARGTKPFGCLACAGAVLIGVTLPTLLVCFSGGRHGVWTSFDHPGPQSVVPDPAWIDVIAGWVGLQAAAAIGCGPGAILLGWVVYNSCAKAALGTRETILRGMWIGALAAFANAPGYLVNIFLNRQTLWGLKMAVLFAVAGASAGAWIGWQAYRAAHPGERFWPRYTLATLLLVVFAWGTLLMIFAPKVD